MKRKGGGSGWKGIDVGGEEGSGWAGGLKRFSSLNKEK